MRMLIVLTASTLWLGVAHAAGPETSTTSPGKDVRIGAYSVFRSEGCSAGPAPDIKLTKAPASGVIVLQEGTLTTTRVPNCPKISGPVKQITYRPNPGFTGSDAVSFEVVDTAAGKTDQHTVVIEVR